MNQISVKGMSCGHCTGSVKKTLEENGATNVSVDLSFGLVKYEGEVDNIKELIEDLGFEVI